MNDSNPGHPVDDADRSERLESWKEIAAYLRRGVTTVQRWEHQENLPVHRLPHAKKGTIFALKSELDEWRRAREQLGLHHHEESDAQESTRPPPHPPASVPLGQRVGVALLVMLALAISGVGLSRVTARRSANGFAPWESSLIQRPLAVDAAGERCPSLSPDGSRVVYSWDRADGSGLYIKPIDGSPRPLPTGEAGRRFWCGYPKWSPKGDLIAFLAYGEGESKNVWLLAPDGSRPRLLTSASGIDLAWTPDGQSLAFVDRNSPGEPFSIFLIPVQGGQRRRLTTPPAGSFGDTHCAFSPDGRRLAIVRYPNRHESDLFVMRIDEPHREEMERLTTGFSGITGVDWSPDGRVIVFGSHQGLWKVSLASARRPTRVVPFRGGAYFPAFSRESDGRSSPRLVYQVDVTDVNIWRWDLVEHQASKITGSTWYDDFPAVSPSGDQVAFASNRTGETEIWVAKADGSDPRQLTFHRGPVVMSPAWSPDGSHLAFSSAVGGNRDIYVIRSDGSQSTRITTAPSEETNPSWSPDGRWIYFRSDQSGVGQLWKVPTAGGTPVRLTTGEALRGFPSPDGRVVYFVRSADVPGLWSVPVDGGQETIVLSEVRDGYWAVADSGIFFIVRRPRGSGGANALEVFSFVTARTSTLPPPPGGWGYLHPGFSAARNGRFVLWTRKDNAISDLMLVEP